MIKCGLCNGDTRSGEKPVAVILATRSVVYPFRAKVQRISVPPYLKDDPGGNGTEIVKQVLAHKKCAEKGE